MLARRISLTFIVGASLVAVGAKAEQSLSSGFATNPYAAASHSAATFDDRQAAASAERTYRLPADGLAALRKAVRVSSIEAAVPATNDAERADGVRRRALAAAELRAQAAAHRAWPTTPAALATPLGRTIVDSQVQAASWNAENAESDVANPLRRLGAMQAPNVPSIDGAGNPLR